jgi:hypothetical protein
MALEKLESVSVGDDPAPAVKKKPYQAPAIWEASASETETGINNGTEILILLS